MEQNKQIAQAGFYTKLSRVADSYMPMINSVLEENRVPFSPYAKQCVAMAIGAINTVLTDKGLSWNDPQLDPSNITSLLLNVATLQLNATAQPREVYFQTRNKRISVTEDGRKSDKYITIIEMGVEGDGNDALLCRFGRDVKKVCPFWLVRENDLFEFPKFNGLEMSPPQWMPKGTGDVVRVVYPIIKTDNTVDFYIGERSDVLPNLIAHVNNNLMNETFGIADSAYKATAEQKKKIKAQKNVLLQKVKQLGFAALDDDELEKYISPAWREPQSREQMIIRKIRNNIVKKIPKDFGSAFMALAYESLDEGSREASLQIQQNANKEPLGFGVVEPQSEPITVSKNEESLKPSSAQVATPVQSSMPFDPVTVEVEAFPDPEF